MSNYGTNEDIHEKTISGIKWTYLSSFLSRGFYPLVLIILARLLSPSDFGLAAMAMVVMTFFSCFSDLGLKHALVQQKGDASRIATIAFWIMLLLGGFWFFLLWVIAPYVANYYRNEAVTSLLRTLSLVFLIQPFSDVPLSLLLRDLKFKALFYRQFIPQIFSGTFSIVFALMGYGAWALIFGYIAGMTGMAFVVWRQTHWRPQIYFESKIFRNMFRFGSFLSIQQILGWMMTRVDNLFVGRYLGAEILGIYRMGFTYGNLPFQLVGLPFLNVAYPVFCRLNLRHDELKGKYLLYIEWVALVIIPVSVAFVFVMPFMVPVLLGEKWLPSVLIIQLIAISFVPAAIVGLNSEAYKAIGRPDVGTKFFIVRVLISLPFYYFAAQKSIVMLALTHIGLAGFFVPLNFLVCSFVLKLPYKNIFRRLLRGFILGFILALTGLLYNRFISDNIIYNALINTGFLSMIMIAIAIITLFIIDRGMLIKIQDFLRDTLKYKAKEAIS